VDHEDEQAEQEHGQMLGGSPPPPDRLTHAGAQTCAAGAGLRRICA
jgi:hypothetical protein